MNWKRAIIASVAAYIVTFIVGIVTALIMRVDLSGETQPPASVWWVGIVLSVLIIHVASLWYFQKEKATVQKGLHLGLAFIGVGFAMDILAFLSFFVSEGNFDAIVDYYSNPLFWVAVLVVVGTATVTGHIKEKKRR